jgi:hypothetical protein
MRSTRLAALGAVVLLALAACGSDRPSAASRRVTTHSAVTTVPTVATTTAPPPPSPCTPGYTPCLAPAADYDCLGGAGDGPAFTGPVSVLGPDVYDLDRDGDHAACEPFSSGRSDDSYGEYGYDPAEDYGSDQFDDSDPSEQYDPYEDDGQYEDPGQYDQYEDCYDAYSSC